MPGIKTGPKGPRVSLIQDKDIALVAQPDFTVTVLGRLEGEVRRVVNFCVSREVCMSSAYLRPLVLMSDDPTEVMLGGGKLRRKGGNKNGELEGENIEGVLVWLAHLYKLSDEAMKEKGLYEVSIVAIWHALSLWSFGEKKKDAEDLKQWFHAWYATSCAKVELDIKSARSLALPCQLFDHAEGFARVTKYLVYNNGGHIKERLPDGIKGKRLHLAPSMFIGPVNHARGGLKNILHKNMWSKLGHLLRSETDACTCWDATTGQYIKSLADVDIFPLDDFYSFTSRCRNIDFGMYVRKGKAAAQAYFDGLCLDCMDRSKPKGKDLDEEYWRHNSSVGNRWDTRCRIKHGQPSWYVSWLGRDDTRQKLLKGKDGYHRDDYDDEE
ncbi:hypothetical protein BDV95DRAFT_628168 [Massariosphaeria phaeospora]|uniref:Uncharacterized protein n=1 Tax=Massariosphaeria phaeospora TaxID=100035 RepID=A0A7C8IF13_9PLEO|nr:hypothetical protein BDV95DRAFT_628168 [Massariosphaeria phaeospora]